MLPFTLSPSLEGQNQLLLFQRDCGPTAAITSGFEDTNSNSLLPGPSFDTRDIRFDPGNPSSALLAPDPSRQQQLDYPPTTTSVSFDQIASLLQLQTAANLLGGDEQCAAASDAVATPTPSQADTVARILAQLTSLDPPPTYPTYMPSAGDNPSNVPAESGSNRLGVPLPSSSLPPAGGGPPVALQKLFITDAEAALATMTTTFQQQQQCRNSADQFSSRPSGSFEPDTPSTIGGPSTSSGGSSRSPSAGSVELQAAASTSASPLSPGWPLLSAEPLKSNLLPATLTGLLMRYINGAAAGSPSAPLVHPTASLPAMTAASLQQALSSIAAATPPTADGGPGRRVRRRRRRNNGSRISISEGLPPDITRTQVAMLLARYGRVRDIQITGSRAASARLPSAAIAETAIRELNGSTIYPDYGPLQIRNGKRVVESSPTTVSQLTVSLAATFPTESLDDDALLSESKLSGRRENDCGYEESALDEDDDDDCNARGFARHLDSPPSYIVNEPPSAPPPDQANFTHGWSSCAVSGHDGLQYSAKISAARIRGGRSHLAGNSCHNAALVTPASSENARAHCEARSSNKGTFYGSSGGCELPSAHHSGHHHSSEKCGPPGANLFVFHIPGHWTEAELTNTFARFGRIVQARIATDRLTRRRLGFGFVSFSNIHEAATAVRVMNGARVGGKWLKVTVKRGEEASAAAAAAALTPHTRSSTSHDLRFLLMREQTS